MSQITKPIMLDETGQSIVAELERLTALQGPKGETGEKGDTGVGISSIVKTSTSGLVDTYTITFSNSNTTTFNVTNGAAGANGQDGADGDDGNGISSISKTSTSGLVDTYTISYTDGTTSTFSVTNGANGADGEDGADGADGKGISSIAKTSTAGLVDTYTITYTDSSTSTYNVTNGADGEDGEDGSIVTVSASGTATDEVQYITIDGVEKKLAGGGGGSSYTFTNGLSESSGTVSWDLNDSMRKSYDSVILTKAAGYSSKVYANSSAKDNLLFGYVDRSGSKGEIQAESSSGNLIFGEANNGYAIKVTGSSGYIHSGNLVGGFAGNTNITCSETRGCLIFGQAANDTIYAWNSSGSIGVGNGVNVINAEGCAGFGKKVYTSGIGSQAFGIDVQAYNSGQMAHGKYNIYDTAGTYAEIIGNGTSSGSRSNAYTIDWNGNAVFAGTVSSVGADYAEYFEWEDGNPLAEDRIGYIVTLNGNKLKYANSSDYILGIISGTATILGDQAEWYWHNRYLQDEFGRFLYDDYDIEHKGKRINPETGEEEEYVIFVEHIHARKQNPEWNPDEPYTKRSERPEWAEVGMMGKIYVRDDGTCAVNGFAKAVNGIASASSEPTNMRVMERVSANVIKVCLK